MATEWTIPEMVDYVERKKTSLLLRHGVIAVFVGTSRVITKEGRRSVRRKKTGQRRIGKSGFMDSWNIIVNQFSTYGYFMNARNPLLTGQGKTRDRLHRRDPDSKRRDLLFQLTYEKLFKQEREQWRNSQ